MKTITVNANIQFDIHNKATADAIENIITLINDTLSGCEFESQPQIMCDSVKLVLNEQEEEIQYLCKRLWEMRVQFENEARTNEIAWVDETIDRVEIGFLKKEADSDQQHEFEDDGLELTYEEAKEELMVRFNNFAQSLGIETTVLLPTYKD